MDDQWNHKMFNAGPENFGGLAMEAFQHQYRHNPVYRSFVDAIGVRPERVAGPEGIPFLPIRFFKSHEVKTGAFRAEMAFESSGTTGMQPSRHYVRDTGLYRESFCRSFEMFYGPVTGWCMIGLLPSYLERGNSSLVFMVDELIKRSNQRLSGFYLDQFEQLAQTLNELEANGQKTMVIGVSFALLDFAERFPMPLKHTVLMETGGMKGRRKEMVREELHEVLKSAFGVPAIHSEYGMTELLSQAYSAGGGIYQCPPWMRVLLREEEDPLTIKSLPVGNSIATGAINVIDLANIHSCCFIATDDAGLLYPDGRFEVRGRMDNSDLRGCSLMLVEA